MIRAVVWDFDGVLNRNVVDGRFVWSGTFHEDIGHPIKHFAASIFQNIERIMTGQEDLRDRVERWCEDVGYSDGPDAILDYWFAKDALPDPEMLSHMERLSKAGIRQVIGTNNEARRARYIEQDMGFGTRVERIFSSARIGYAKPDRRFFDHVAAALSLPPEMILLVDDMAANIEAARALGWNAIHFTDETRHALGEHLPL